MFGFIRVYSDAGAPGVENPVIIEQFLRTNGLGNGCSLVLLLDIKAMRGLSTVDGILTVGFLDAIGPLM